MAFAVGSLVHARGREWVVLPDSVEDLLLLRPLGGSADEVTGIHTPLEPVTPASFALPDPNAVGDYRSCRLLRDALRLGFRSSAGPFRSLGGIAVDPRPYQMVPLLMALKLDPVRLLIADDLGIGKTIEAGLVARELLDRGEVSRLAVLCLPHLVEQWQRELQEKFHIEAEAVLPGTVARLERPCRHGESLFDLYPFVVASIEFLKSDRRRDDFVRACPELVIVDEAHICAAADEERRSRKQRYELVRDLCNSPERHVLLVTGTPHSGKEAEFRSLLSFLDPSFAALPADLSGSANEPHRRRLAAHFVQRRRADITSYLDADTPFPKRDEQEETYRLSPAYGEFLEKVIRYARERVSDPSGTHFQRRIRYWSALALLRSVCSSPDAAAATLRSRAKCSSAGNEEEADRMGRRSVMDLMVDDAAEGEDAAPGADAEEETADTSERRRLRALAVEADALTGDQDAKLARAIELIRGLVREGFRPIVFCRFIPTAEYVANALRHAMRGVEVAAVTGMLPHEEREARVLALAEAEKHVLVCTDCLSEGINLQDHFDAVMHYDLSWNPTRHEQREGRVDRYGQPSPKVRVVSYYGIDNRIDGLVLNVWLRKHQSMRDDLGISVPVPADAENVMEAIFEGLLLREDWGRQTDTQLSLLDLLAPSDRGDLYKEQRDLHKQWDDAANREKRSRTLFAQHAIKVQEVAGELSAAREAIGSGVDVEGFVRDAFALGGAIVSARADGVAIDLSEAQPALRDLSTDGLTLDARFALPVREGQTHLNRTHPIVEGLANFVLEGALDSQEGGIASRSGAIHTRAVSRRTTLLLVRFRYHLITTRGGKEIPQLAEECRLLAFEGAPANAVWLEDAQAEALFSTAPDRNIDPERARDFVARVVDGYPALLPHLEQAAQERSTALLEAHRRVRTAARQRGVRVRVEPNLPPDIVGIYVYLPLV